ncbi:hypothetical protein CSKR_108971 [Clonorchis sinensis]|uniref:Uncharacterized protein n=1 Tax=Clonorchis sinensis TaxID=79923 RepID=A0A419PQJ9_CLOSI|nr:hypothetical protein CSKR_108971 [Clonorchis sinensis]
MVPGHKSIYFEVPFEIFQTTTVSEKNPRYASSQQELQVAGAPGTQFKLLPDSWIEAFAQVSRVGFSLVVQRPPFARKAHNRPSCARSVRANQPFTLLNAVYNGLSPLVEPVAADDLLEFMDFKVAIKGKERKSIAGCRRLTYSGVQSDRSSARLPLTEEQRYNI